MRRRDFLKFSGATGAMASMLPFFSELPAWPEPAKACLSVDIKFDDLPENARRRIMEESGVFIPLRIENQARPK